MYFHKDLYSTIPSTFVQQQKILSNSSDFTPSSPVCHFSMNTKIFFCLVNVFACTLSILANVLFCCAVYRRPKLQKLSFVLLVSLSITDIIISLSVPFFLFTYTAFFPDWPLGHIGTDSFNSMWSFAIVAPFITVTAIAVERYFSINRRELYQKYWTKYTMGFIVLFIWLYSLLWVYGIASCFKHQAEIVERYHWNIHHGLYYTFIGINVGIPLFLIPFLYHLVRRHIKFLRGSSSNNPIEESDKAFTDSMMYVVVTLFIMWIPVLIVELFYTEFNDQCVVKIIDLINTFLSINCFLNPILYSYGNREVRKGLLFSNSSNSD